MKDFTASQKELLQLISEERKGYLRKRGGTPKMKQDEN